MDPDSSDKIAFESGGFMGPDSSDKKSFEYGSDRTQVTKGPVT